MENDHCVFYFEMYLYELFDIVMNVKRSFIIICIPWISARLCNMSNRRENYFITPNPSTSFVYQSAFMWNSCYKLSSLYNIEFSTATVTVKHKLKTVLFNVQKQFYKYLVSK